MKFYFTFGQAHVNHDGKSLKDCYCVIEAEEYEEARRKFIEVRGFKWASVYTDKKKVTEFLSP